MNIRDTIKNSYRLIEKELKLQLSNVSDRRVQLENTFISPKELRQDIIDIRRSNSKIRNDIHRLIDCLPDENYELTAEKADMEIRFENDIYIYDLKESIPNRIKLNLSSKAIEYDIDRSYYYSRYRNCVLEYEESEGFHMFQNKILVYIQCLYIENARDHDNLEIKPFLDAAVNKILVPDDNMELVSIFFDSCKCDHDGARIYIGDFQNMLLQLNQFISVLKANALQ